MPLSLGQVCQGSKEEVARRTIPTLTPLSRDSMLARKTCDPSNCSHSCMDNQSYRGLEHSEGSVGRGCFHSYRICRDVCLQDGLELGLGLGCPPEPHGGGGGSGTGLGLGSSCLECRKQDSLMVDLDLGLTQSYGLEVTNDSQMSSRVLHSNVTSLEQASQGIETDGCLYDRCEAGPHMPLHIQCENPQGTSKYLKIGGDLGRDPGKLISASDENACGMDLELGLSATLHSADSDCLPHFFGSFGDPQESRRDATHDEGSTSAKWMKSKGNIMSVLHHSQSGLNQTDSLCPSVVLEDASELDPPGEEEAVAFPHLSPKVPRTTASDSSNGALARSSDRASKMCKFKGCGKGARGASGLCIAHGGGRRCQRPNCNKGAEGRTMYCKAHGGGRRCQRLGCIKSAEGKTDFCIGHGGGRRCNAEGCNKAARGKSGLCIRHGGGKRCQKEGCTKSAEGYAGLCISHGGGRRCQYLNCGKGAQGSTMYCKAHGGGRRCEFEGCTKGAEGSTPRCKAHGGGKRCMFGGGTCTKSVHGGTLFCVAHGGGKRCAVPGCTKSARGRTDHCVRHGGGKRCKIENCSKSAQGSTDFCKAHGGGKKCSWCQEGSMYSEEFMNDRAVDHLKKPCDRFARGKTGLCAAHNAIMQKLRVSWDGISCLSYAKGIIPDGANDSVSRSIENEHSFPSFSDASEQYSQFSSDHDEPPLGIVESQLLPCPRANFEVPQKDSDFLENQLSPPAESRRCFTSDKASHDVNFGGHMDHAPLRSECPGSWAIPHLSASHDRSPVRQHPHESPSNSALPPQSSFSATQVVFPSSLQNEELLLCNNMQCIGHSFPLSASDSISRELSFSLPEERVHGGGLMALLAKEAARHRGLQ